MKTFKDFINELTNTIAFDKDEIKAIQHQCRKDGNKCNVKKANKGLIEIDPQIEGFSFEILKNDKNGKSQYEIISYTELDGMMDSESDQSKSFSGSDIKKLIDLMKSVI